jgi:LPS O-antigen subunit length determinant protein (WzzB/FepE family)
MQQGAAMTIRSTFLMTAVLLALAPVAGAQKSADGKAPKKLFCWDDKGTRVCSDALPPEAVNAARQEISAASGLRTGEVARALTEEERAQAAVAAQQLQMDKAAEETRRRTDAAMLLSYRTEEDLRRVFTERTAIVDNNVRTARYNVISLREGLVTLLQTAGDRELAGRPVSPEMAASIRQRHADLIRTRRLQQSFETQRAELDVEIADIMQRYRTAMGIAPAEGTATAPDAPAATDTPPATQAQAPARN